MKNKKEENKVNIKPVFKQSKDMPILEDLYNILGKDKGKIGFGDGRHRLIAAKELGATHAYFELPGRKNKCK